MTTPSHVPQHLVDGDLDGQVVVGNGTLGLLEAGGDHLAYIAQWEVGVRRPRSGWSGSECLATTGGRSSGCRGGGYKF